MTNVAIIGAGLAGSLLAIYLAKRGIEVDIYESRGDMRLEKVAAGRSINLALSDRGIAALRQVGMDEYMLAEAVPMFGRMIHSVSGEKKLLPYSGRAGEYINSVSRAGLNVALINKADMYAGVRFHFNYRCTDFDCSSGAARFSNGQTVKSDTLIAADGAGSAIRNAMLYGGIERFDFSQDWLEHGYKELHIPRGRDGGFLLEKNALHIWPRHQFMMIALPNFDGSFTCTLFLAHSGRKASVNERADGEKHTLVNTPVSATDLLPCFDELTTEAAVMDFFNREFSDAVPLMPTLAGDFFQNPTGNLGTIKCFPWYIGGKALLLGDSAHAVVPFYGQGMNCAFEDVRVLDTLLENYGTDWEKIYEKYGRLRKPNTDAIAEMAEENFYEMRDAVADQVFVRKRELETRLEQTYPDYFSKYSMVTFREDLPYLVAKERGKAQDNLLMGICAEVESVAELDLDNVMARLRTEPISLSMKSTITIDGRDYEVDLSSPIDISIPLRFNGPQPNAYGVESASSKPCRAGDLVGDTRLGGSVNFEQYTFIPHCNGTHTECVGHITHERIAVRDCLHDVLMPAVLVSVRPLQVGGDSLITTDVLRASLPPSYAGGCALIVRTLPNDDGKLTAEYANIIPPYFASEAVAFIVDQGLKHLLVDIPSVDRIFDEGKLLNHRLFWNVAPGSFEAADAARRHSTITELVYVPNEIEDGEYLLNLQIAPFAADASPSRPVLFKTS
ncbi:MAG TPA: FAD-dependent monooxygenase [Pyrinomonadaceae bacterium]|nr:FAD-dependent monooxygenase [Pyrinomonadaceae bacterium]